MTQIDGIPLDTGTLAVALTTLVAAYLLARALAFGLTALSERAGSRRIAVKTLIPLLKFLIYGTAIFTVGSDIFKLGPTEALALSGFLGAALGFGLKDLFAEVVGGIVLVLERPYQVGDKVSVRGEYGEVTDIGLRSTTLVTPDDSAVVVPNDVLFADSLVNANDGAPEMLVVIDLYVATDADYERAAAIMEEALLTSQYLYLEEDHPVVVLVEDDPAYRTIRGKAYVNDLRDEFTFKSDVTRRALAAFEDAGIETPNVAVATSE